MGITIPQEIAALGQWYDIEDGAQEFIAVNGHLIPFLEEMAPVLGSYFPDARLRLELERDPETGREMELWAMGTWAGEDEDWKEPIERLDAFCLNWWFQHSPPVRRQLAVSFDYAEAKTE